MGARTGTGGLSNVDTFGTELPPEAVLDGMETARPLVVQQIKALHGVPNGNSERSNVMSQIVLVAFEVPADNNEQAQQRVMDSLVTMGIVEDGPVDSWWIAQDNRIDGSDNDSAVFRPYSRERCSVCGQPDNCGDCTHEPVSDKSTKIAMIDPLGGRVMRLETLDFYRPWCRGCGVPQGECVIATEGDLWVEDEDDFGYPYCLPCVARLQRQAAGR